MGKSKKSKSGVELSEELQQEGLVADESVKEEKLSHEEKCAFASVIAKPMASRKLTKKIFKMVKSGKW